MRMLMNHKIRLSQASAVFIGLPIHVYFTNTVYQYMYILFIRKIYSPGDFLLVCIPKGKKNKTEDLSIFIYMYKMHVHVE